MTTYLINNNTYFNSLEITFSEKPSETVREVLKAFHFRWNYTKKLWYGYANKQALTEKLNAILKPVFDPAIEPLPPLPEKQHEPESVNLDNVQSVKVDIPESKPSEKTESVEGFKNHNANKKPVLTINKPLLKKQEKALMNLLNYDRNMCIYAAKNGIAFIGNPYVMFKINTELFSSEFLREVKKMVELTGRSQNYDSFEKVFNKNYETVNTDAATIYLTSKSMFTEKECKDIKGNKVSHIYDNNKRVVTFNSRLLKNCLAAFNETCELTVLKPNTPAIVGGTEFTALLMPIYVND